MKQINNYISEKLHLNSNYKNLDFVRPTCNAIDEYFKKEHNISPAAYSIICRDENGSIIDAPSNYPEDVKSIAIHIGGRYDDVKRAKMAEELEKILNEIVPIEKPSLFGGTLFFKLK